MHGLLGILPIQVGITYDSLLTGDTLVGVSLAAEHGPDGTSRLSQSAHSLSLLYHLAQLKLTHYPGVCSRNICYMRDVELHEPLFTALTFHPRSVASAVSAALCPDGDHDDGISSYNEAFAARSNSSSQF